MVGVASLLAEGHISRDDLEGAVRRAVGEVGDRIGERRTPLIAVVLFVGIGVVATAYHLGRRIVRLHSSVVEIRRL